MPDIYVINLADRLDRRMSAAATLDASGLPYCFIDAWDGRVRSAPHAYDGARRRRLAGKELTGGEIGCYMSHIHAMRVFLESGKPWAVIAEDDLIVAPDLPEVLGALSAIHDQLEIVKLGTSEERKRKHRAILPLSSARKLVRISNVSHGTVGYFVTRAGAEKFLRHSRRFFRPVDVAMARTWENGIDVLAVHPWPIVHDLASESSIEQTRFAPPPFELSLAGASRWLNRQWDSIAKRVAYVAAIPRDRALGRRTAAAGEISAAAKALREAA